MDFKSKFVKNSIQLRLALWIIIITFVIAIIGSIAAYNKSLYEAKELQDDTLIQVAAIIENYNLPLRPENVGQEEFRIFISQYPFNNCDSNKCLSLPPDFIDGFHDFKGGAKSYRIFVKTLANKQRLAVGQRTDSRDETAGISTFFTITPLLFLLIILIGGIVIAIRSAFKPVQLYANDLLKRGEDDYSKIDSSGIPAELEPFVASINALLEKILGAVRSQKEFVSNAAHELRTPLTALSLQIENLSSVTNDEKALKIIEKSKKSISSTKHLIDNLLDFARISSPKRPKGTSVSLSGLIKNIIEIHLPIIEKKNIEITLDNPRNIAIDLPEFEGNLILKNLIGNAVKFSPDGGHIYIRLDKNNNFANLKIENSGQRIPDTDLQKLAEPFFRGSNNEIEGSGLGLAIVKQALEKIGGTIDFSCSTKFEAGLLVEIELPD